MDPRWSLVIFCVAGYLIGGLPVGYWATRWRRLGLDIRGYGSGNVGTANVYRHAGFGLAAVVGPIQFLQGLLPVLLGRFVGGIDTLGLALVGISAVVGNGWSIFLRFDGGRGVAVSTGAVAGLNLIALVALLACYAIGALSGHIAEGVLAGFIVLPAFGGVLAVTPVGGGWPLPVAFAVLLVLILFRRLEGVSRDATHFGHARRLVVDRVLHDRRPGRPLIGHRTD
ncbi:MAG TPA: glycerol-3-phosphate acyltransferase [Candidatus Binatia bacterium]|nr:glycerol-3-phosphate acyltransferase [Candidatus Binatia bacterium]